MTNRTPSDEAMLLAQLRQGNALAFEVIYHRYKGLLYAHASRQLKDPEEVRDLIHDIFSNLWESRLELELRESLTAYLFQSVRNRIVNRFLKSKRAEDYVQSFALFLNQVTANTDHLVREQILREQILREVRALPPKMRQVFELSRNEGMSHRQIADELGITEQSVRSHIKGALRVLRTKLSASMFLLFLSHF